MACIGTEQYLSWVWNCWDVPNWLTLIVEIIVATILGVIFLRKGGEFNKELKILRDSQKEGSTIHLSIMLRGIFESMNTLEEICHTYDLQNKNELEPKVWSELSLATEKTSKNVEKVIRNFGTILEGMTINRLTIISNALSKLNNNIDSIKQDILHIRRICVMICKDDPVYEKQEFLKDLLKESREKIKNDYSD